MILPPPRSTRTDTLFPYTTLFRSFGALSVIPVAEIARRWSGLGRGGAGVVVLGWVLAISCLYEVFEWLLTIVAAGETADRYNGQQGDIWDARSEERRVGKECVRTCRSRWSPYH